MNLFKKTFILLCYVIILFITTSCYPSEIIIDIYNYDGDEFILEQHIVKQKDQEFLFPDVNTELDGYTFLGWLEIKGTVEVKTLEELELMEDINYTVFDNPTKKQYEKVDLSYYPIIVKNEELSSFVETSKLAQVYIEVCFVLGDKTESKTYKALLTDTYDDVLLGELEKEGYTYMGVSKTYKSTYLETGLNNLELIDLNNQFEFDGYNKIYVYYENSK